LKVLYRKAYISSLSFPFLFHQAVHLVRPRLMQECRGVTRKDHPDA